jgi:hypothetical protein
MRLTDRVPFDMVRRPVVGHSHSVMQAFRY